MLEVRTDQQTIDIYVCQYMRTRSVVSSVGTCTILEVSGSEHDHLQCVIHVQCTFREKHKVVSTGAKNNNALVTRKERQPETADT